MLGCIKHSLDHTFVQKFLLYPTEVQNLSHKKELVDAFFYFLAG